MGEYYDLTVEWLRDRAEQVESWLRTVIIEPTSELVVTVLTDRPLSSEDMARLETYQDGEVRVKDVAQRALRAIGAEPGNPFEGNDHVSGGEIGDYEIKIAMMPVSGMASGAWAMTKKALTALGLLDIGYRLVDANSGGSGPVEAAFSGLSSLFRNVFWLVILAIIAFIVWSLRK